MFSLDTDVQFVKTQIFVLLNIWNLFYFMLKNKGNNMKSGFGNSYSDLMGYASRSPRSKFVKSSPKSTQGSCSSLSNGQNRKIRSK